MKQRFLVTGTDTGIGKTVFAAALTNVLGAAYWKPVQAGLDGETDSETVARLGQIPRERILPEAWRLRTPASPHLAAALDENPIRPGSLSPPDTSRPLVIEGAGGLLVPLTRHETFASVFERWRIPAVLCARTTLGTINHTLLSLEAMRRRDIPVLGVAYIGRENLETEAIITGMSGIRRLGRLPHLDPLTPYTLLRAFESHFDLSAFRADASR